MSQINLTTQCKKQTDKKRCKNMIEDRYKYCTEHGCPRCFLRIPKAGLFCAEDMCKNDPEYVQPHNASMCHFKIDDNEPCFAAKRKFKGDGVIIEYDYCATHNCKIVECLDSIYEESKYCYEHTCIVEGCLRQAILDNEDQQCSGCASGLPAEHPTPIIEEPVIEQPVQVIEQPVQVIEEPVQVIEEPVQVVEQPIIEQPVQVIEEPVQVIEQPIIEQPVVIAKSFSNGSKPYDLSQADLERLHKDFLTDDKESSPFLETLFRDGGFNPKCSSSPLMSKTFTEFIDMNRLAFIIEHMDEIEVRPDARDQVDLTKLYAKASQVDGNIGSFSTSYKQAVYKTKAMEKAKRGFKPILKGRHMADGAISAQGLVREVRHSIYNDTMIDIDICNAHPVFIMKICKWLGIRCEFLEQYVSDRSKVFESLKSSYPGKTKDDFKRLFLSINNGGSAEFYKFASDKCVLSEFVKNYYIESQCIRFAIFSKLPKILKLSNEVYETKEHAFENRLGSAMSHLCCYIENYVLSIALDLLASCSSQKNALKSVLCFDGLMICKDTYNSIDGGFENVLTNKFADLGFPIKWEIKNMTPIDLDSFGYDPSISYIERRKDMLLEEGTYVPNIAIKYNSFEEDEYCFQDFLEHMCQTTWEGPIEKCTELLSYVSMNFPRIAAWLSDESVIYKKNNDDGFFSFDAFHRVFSKSRIVMFKIDGVIKSCSLENVIRSCFSSKKIRMFNTCSANFNYGTTNEREFVLNRRFVANFMQDYRSSSSLNGMLNFIKNIVCGGVDEQYQFELDKLAVMLKYPNKKTGVSTILITAPTGCGKNSYTDFLCDYVFGKYNAISNVNGIDELLGQFNGHTLGKKLIVVNEMAANGNKFLSNFDKIKSLITETSQKLELKYQNARHVDTATEYIFTSNNFNSFHVSDNTSRREFIPDFNTSLAGNLEYFINFRRNFHTQECGDAFYSFLMSRDITFEAFKAKKVPLSNLKKQVVIQSQNNEKAFLDWLHESCVADSTSTNYQIFNDVSEGPHKLTPAFNFMGASFDPSDDKVFGIFRGDGFYEQSFCDMYKTYLGWMSRNAPGKAPCSKKNLGGKLLEDCGRFEQKRTRVSRVYRIMLLGRVPQNVEMDESLIN